jgi:uncharacterized protein (DUF58 family)
MLDTIAIILLIAWLLGMASSYTLGGYIYALLILAVLLVVVGRIKKRPKA